MPFKNSNGLLFYCITAGRLAILVLLLCSTYLLPRYFADTFGKMTHLSLILGGAFFLTAVYIIWYKKSGLNKWLLYIQTLFDVILVNLAVFWTGGPESPLVFLYPIVILTACILGSQKEGAASTFLCTISYAALFWFGEIPGDKLNDALYIFFINIAAFNIIASLGIILVQRLYYTEKKLSDIKVDLRRMEEIHRHLADSIQSGLITVNEKGNITFFNQAAIKILGQKIINGYGKPLQEFWPTGIQLLENFRNSREGKRQEVSHTDPPGSSKILGISTFLLKDPQEQTLGYGIIFQDITEIKAREKRLQRMDRLAALGEMAAGLAHEIRNPLASLSGAAQFLEESALLQPEERRLLQIISKESDRLNDLTRSFLLYAKPEEKKIQNISLLEEIESVFSLMKQRKKFPQADVKIDVPANLQFEVDPSQFKQVLLNLLLNAYQALPHEDGRISINGTSEGGDHLVLKISDNGTGIRPEDLSSVFNPFFTTRPDGTGLGLAIVHRLIHEWNGDITVDSEQGKGSTFTLYLPKRMKGVEK
ncbi:MAG TPA: PAS domain S-box protein [Deltaproteobacteria bacterium]|nr:PAS domain S-box protein [Deltaproteobacteria bacterium]